MNKLLHGSTKRRFVVDIMLTTMLMITKFFLLNETVSLANKITTISNTEIKHLAIMFAFYLVIEIAFDAIQNVYIEISFQRLCHNSLIEYFSEIYNVKPEILKKKNTGYVNDILTKLVNYQASAYIATVWELFYAVLYMMYAITRLWLIHWSLGLTLFVALSISAVLLTKGKQINRKNMVESNKKSHELCGFIFDTIINIGTIQKMNAKKFIDDTAEDKKNSYYKALNKQLVINELYGAFSKLVIWLFLPVNIYLMTVFDFNKLECVALTTLLSTEIFNISRSIMRYITSKERFGTSYEELSDIIKPENMRKDLFTDSFKELEICDLEYQYKVIDKDNSLQETKICIPDFVVNAGDKVCITGESGQGKTTLLNLLSNEIETNSVLLNRKTCFNRLNCIFVSQDTEILDMTLKENLTFGRDIPDSEIVRALEDVGLGKWYENLHDKLNSRLGEKGVFVSTGQRQRLNLVRGLLDYSKEVYILDEPTSNVDAETEQAMVKFIEKRLQNKTLICVTHRPAIKEICNKMYVFENNTLRLR